MRGWGCISARGEKLIDQGSHKDSRRHTSGQRASCISEEESQRMSRRKAETVTLSQDHSRLLRPKVILHGDK